MPPTLLGPCTPCAFLRGPMGSSTRQVSREPLSFLSLEERLTSNCLTGKTLCSFCLYVYIYIYIIALAVTAAVRDHYIYIYIYNANIYVSNPIWCSAVEHKEEETEGNVFIREPCLPLCWALCTHTPDLCSAVQAPGRFT